MCSQCAQYPVSKDCSCERLHGQLITHICSLEGFVFLSREHHLWLTKLTCNPFLFIIEHFKNMKRCTTIYKYKKYSRYTEKFKLFSIHHHYSKQKIRYRNVFKQYLKLFGGGGLRRAAKDQWASNRTFLAEVTMLCISVSTCNQAPHRKDLRTYAGVCPRPLPQYWGVTGAR